MRIVITGRQGQVVRSLVERASKTHVGIVPLGRPQLDLAGPQEAIIAAIEATVPDLLVSAAAYTEVDKAESEPELSFAVNRDGPRAIAVAARRLGVPLIHLSTDYVFDGCKGSPYLEDDETGPRSIYGASKLAGEEAVLAQQANCAVLRTSWLYSPFGTNFVKTMLRLASERDEIRVVADQHGSPTSALDVADGILQVAANLASGRDPSKRGIFHMSATGEASWASFAEAIFGISAELGGPFASVNWIASVDYPTTAIRPANSRLDSTKLQRSHAVRLPDWRTSLKRVVSRLVARA